VPTLASLGVILGILAVTTTTSLIASRRTDARNEQSAAEQSQSERTGV
jgi:hypothetical protein